MWGREWGKVGGRGFVIILFFSSNYLTWDLVFLFDVFFCGEGGFGRVHENL